MKNPLRFSLAATLLACGLLTCPALAQQTAYSHGDPSALEQQMLEMINRARMNPAQEGIILDSLNTSYSRDARTRKPSFFTNLRAEFASYPAVPPLAFHPKLIQAARAHSQDMITRNFFQHVNPGGLDPTARAAALGYDAGVGENINSAGASTADEVLHCHFGFMVDYDNVETTYPLGHRLNVLNAGYSEAGAGIIGPYSGGRITQDFGVPTRAYILGVAYNDGNNNGAYDPGEGLAGISVRPNTGNWYAITSSSGGFAIPVDVTDTVSDNVSLPFPVNGTPWSSVLPYDTAYRQQQIAAAPSQSVTLTWSGGNLTSPRTSTVSIKRPQQRNFRLTGTDGWYYSRSMVTAQNAKADLITQVSGTTTTPPSPPPQLPGWQSAQLTTTANAAVGQRTGTCHATAYQYCYKGTDNKIWAVYWTGSRWAQAALTSTANVDDWLSSYSAWNFVYYKGTDNHLWVLYYSGGWKQAKLGATANVASDVAVSEGWNVVFYRGTDNRAWAVYWTGSSWAQFPLGGIANVADSLAVDPDSRIVYYRGADNQLWCYYLAGNRWQQKQLSQLANVGGSVIRDAGLLAYYRSATDNSAWCVYWNGTAWVQKSLDSTASLTSQVSLWNQYYALSLNTAGQCEMLYFSGTWRRGLIGDGGSGLNGGLAVHRGTGWVFAQRADGHVVRFDRK